MTVQVGCMEEPNVEAVLAEMARHREINLPTALHRWTVHVAVEKLLPSRSMGVFGHLRLRLFLILRQISQPAYYFYGMGDNVQLSAQIMPVRLK